MKSALLGIGCAVLFGAQAIAQGATKATATFVDVNGKEIGGASLTQTPNGVMIAVNLRGLPPGEHAFHVHEKGVCEPATKFMSAGGHFNPGGKKHGYMVEGGPHGGDMPNQHVGADGALKANVFNPNVTLGAGAGSLFGADGAALVVHASPDDYAGQPAGNAGDRIACAVIKRE
jgi:Cu-Zn family superoxide dismutase